ncbi:hypothetical protein MCOR25_000810 [Pyricularia grisea]|nr:hypothetical protein MCOR25_000810 [Pyricularia grisea]
MGSIISLVSGAVAALRMLLDPLVQFRKALERAAISPGLPVPLPTTPRWTRDPPHPHLVGQQSSEFPNKVDVAIVGSGITAAAVAWSLLQHGDAEQLGSIAVLEARDLCGGATCRNGGHIKASPWEVYPRLAERFGHDRAVALTRFQRRHLDVLVDLCNARGIDAAHVSEVETVDLFLDEASFDDAVKKVAETTSRMPEEEAVVWQREEAKEKFRVGPTVHGAISYKAGVIWAYRFVTSIWQQLLSEHPDVLSIETHTPVEAITIDDAEAPQSHPYALRTPRGTVYARNVVHASGAHVSHLVPGLRSKVTPARAHMSAQRPGDLFPANHGRHRSWSVIYGTGFDYVTQLPPEAGEIPSQGDLMLGGGFFRSLKYGTDMLGISDDGAPLDGLTLAHVAGVFPAVFAPNWGVGGGLKEAWSGILDFTGDLLPLVGKLDGKITGRTVKGDPGSDGKRSSAEWVAAGFSGEGMVWCWLSGMALGIKMSGREEEDLDLVPGRPAGRLRDWFPDELWVSQTRLKAADVSNLANEV